MGSLSMLERERMVVGVGFEGLMNVMSLFSTVRVAVLYAMELMKKQWMEATQRRARVSSNLVQLNELI